MLSGGAGTPPEEDLRALMAIIVNGQATSLNQRRNVAGCPPVILALTTRCLQTDPVQRPAFPFIVDELEHIQGELRASRPPTKLMRADVLLRSGTVCTVFVKAHAGSYLRWSEGPLGSKSATLELYRSPY